MDRRQRRSVQATNAREACFAAEVYFERESQLTQGGTSVFGFLMCGYIQEMGWVHKHP